MSIIENYSNRITKKLSGLNGGVDITYGRTSQLEFEGKSQFTQSETTERKYTEN